MREARLYLEMVERLQNQKFLNLKKDALGQEVFGIELWLNIQNLFEDY